MANRVKRRAWEEAQLAFENSIRQKLKSHKQQQKQIRFSFLQRERLLNINFKTNQITTCETPPKELALFKFCKRFLHHANLKNYFPVYNSPKELLSDLLQNKFLINICIQQEKSLTYWMFQAAIIRPIHTWKPHFKRNKTRLLWSFVEHCYIRYPHQVPFYIQRHFHNYCHYKIKLQSPYWIKGFNLVFHLAEGKGWHRYPGFTDFRVPAKANFYIQQTPKRYRGNYLLALYWACLRAYKISKKGIDLFWSTFISNPDFYLKHGIDLFRYIATQDKISPRDAIKLFYLISQLINFLIENFPNGFDDYYCTVIRFFIPEFRSIGMNELSAWLEFIKAKKEEGMPLKMKGRSIVAFRDKFSQHLLAEYTVQNNSSWKGVERSDYYTDSKFGHFRIVQLKTDFDLYAEGQLMSHCVYSYAEDCAKGLSSIWSLQEMIDPENWKSLVTIELNENKRISQALSRFNYTPLKKHQILIKSWAEKEQLEHSKINA